MTGLTSVWFRRAQGATLGVLALVSMAIALNSVGMAGSAAGTDARIAQAIHTIPSLFFVAAIWLTQRAFGAMARGEAIEAALGRLVPGIGTCLVAGGATFVFVQPLLLRAFTERYSAIAWFDVPAITLGCLGLLLIALSAAFRSAAQKSAELEGFV